jgi:hypothetical protein
VVSNKGKSCAKVAQFRQPVMISYAREHCATIVEMQLIFSVQLSAPQPRYRGRVVREDLTRSILSDDRRHRAQPDLGHLRPLSVCMAGSPFLVGVHVPELFRSTWAEVERRTVHTATIVDMSRKSFPTTVNPFRPLGAGRSHKGRVPSNHMKFARTKLPTLHVAILMKAARFFRLTHRTTRTALESSSSPTRPFKLSMMIWLVQELRHPLARLEGLFVRCCKRISTANERCASRPNRCENRHMQ